MKIAWLLGLVAGAGLLGLESRALSAQSLDLSIGSVRQALREQRAAIVAHPSDPALYVALAYTLCDAGMNDLAIETMRKAIQAAPNSAFAYDAQAWVLRHNTVGEDFGRGFDYDKSLASYKNAIPLDPDGMATRESLANLLEHNREGVEYGSGANLAAAIDTYRVVKAHQHPFPIDLEENLTIALFYSGFFQQAVTESASLPATIPMSAKLQGVQVAAVTALQGSAAGIAVASALRTSEERKAALVFAAVGLWNMRLYSRAADLLSASLPNPEVPGIAAQIQLFRELKPFHRQDLPEGDPRRPVQRLLVGIVLGTLTETEMSECLAPSMLQPGASWKSSLGEMQAIAGILRSLSKKTGLPAAVVEDITLGNISIRSVDWAQPGARVAVSLAGTAQLQFFVLKEDGVLKVAGTANDLPALGREALHLLRTGREAEAAALLNWRREFAPRDQGSDPLSGPLFARVWSSGKSKGRASIEMAAASVLEDPTELKTLLPTVRAEDMADQPGFPHDTDELILARSYLESGDLANGLKVAQRLLTRYPDSATAAALTGRALQLNQSTAEWRTLVEKGVAQHPEDKTFLLAGVRQAEAEGDFGRALQRAQKILDSANVDAADEARYAGLSVFAGQAGEEAQQAAQRAVLGTKVENAEYLTTAAWVNASIGNTAQARELLLEAMRAAQLEEPNAGIWFGFGRIYEQYGETQEAIAAYQRVVATAPAEGDLALVAQKRLKALQ